MARLVPAIHAVINHREWKANAPLPRGIRIVDS
jgi:hypothetical protein